MKDKTLIWDKENFKFLTKQSIIETTEFEFLNKYYLTENVEGKFKIIGYKYEMKKFVFDKIYGIMDECKRNFDIYYYFNNPGRKFQNLQSDVFVETIIRSSLKICIINLAKIISKNLSDPFSLNSLNIIFDNKLNIKESSFRKNIFGKKVMILRNKHYAHSDFKSQIEIDNEELADYINEIFIFINNAIQTINFEPEGFGYRYNINEVNGSKYFDKFLIE